MNLRINPVDASDYSIVDGDRVAIYNKRGRMEITAYLDKSVREGTLVTLGVWWQEQCSDPCVGINALTADRPTDEGWGSTFYDVQVHLERLS